MEVIFILASIEIFAPLPIPRMNLPLRLLIKPIMTRITKCITTKLFGVLTLLSNYNIIKT